MKLDYPARPKNGQNKIEINGNKTPRNFGLMVKKSIFVLVVN